MRSPEYQHPAGVDRHLLPGLGITADTASLLAHGKAAERRNLDHLAARQRFGNLVQDCLDEFCRLVARQSNLLIDGLAELSPRNRLPRHATASPFEQNIKPGRENLQIQMLV